MPRATPPLPGTKWFVPTRPPMAICIYRLSCVQILVELCKTAILVQLLILRCRAGVAALARPREAEEPGLDPAISAGCLGPIQDQIDPVGCLELHQCIALLQNTKEKFFSAYKQSFYNFGVKKWHSWCVPTCIIIISDLLMPIKCH